MIESKNLKIVVIRHLINHECWGGKYTDAIRIVPKHQRGEIKEVLKELVKIEWLVPKNKNETLFRLNPRKKAEIEQFYSKFNNIVS